MSTQENNKVDNAFNSLSVADLMNHPNGPAILAAMSGEKQVNQPSALRASGEELLASAARAAGGVLSESVEVATIRGIMEDSERKGKRARILERCGWIVFILIWNFNAIAAYNATLKPTFDAPGKRTLVRVKQIMDSSEEALEIARARVIEIDEELDEMPPGLDRYELEAEKGKQLIALTTLDDTLSHYKELHEANMAMTDSSVTADFMASWAKKNPGRVFEVDND